MFISNAIEPTVRKQKIKDHNYFLLPQSKLERQIIWNKIRFSKVKGLNKIVTNIANVMPIKETQMPNLAH